MKHDIETAQLNAFVDGELDLTSQLAMEERLKHDADLSAQAETLSTLHRVLHEKADYHAAPLALRQHVASMIAPAPSSASHKHPPSQRALALPWWNWQPLLLAFAVVATLALVLNLTWLSTLQNDRLMDDVVASHVRSTLSQHLVDIPSSEHHTVKPWLSSKLDFSPPVNELQIPGSVLLGGRIDYLDGHPVAAVVYRQGQHVVNSFVWPSNAKDSEVKLATNRGFQIAHWSHHGMTHWVVSDVNHVEFIRLVQALETAER